MSERMTGERFRVLWGYAMSPQMKPWIAELANGFGVEREYAERECHWNDEDDGCYATGCGHLWQFIDGGPEENGTSFCPCCGGKIVESDDG